MGGGPRRCMEGGHSDAWREGTEQLRTWSGKGSQEARHRAAACPRPAQRVPPCLPPPAQVNRSRPHLVLADPNLHYAYAPKERPSGFFTPRCLLRALRMGAAAWSAAPGVPRGSAWLRVGAVPRALRALEGEQRWGARRSHLASRPTVPAPSSPLAPFPARAPQDRGKVRGSRYGAGGAAQGADAGGGRAAQVHLRRLHSPGWFAAVSVWRQAGAGVCAWLPSHCRWAEQQPLPLPTPSSVLALRSSQDNSGSGSGGSGKPRS